MSRKTKRNTHNANVLFASEIQTGDSQASQMDNQTDKEKQSLWSRLGSGERIAIIAVCLLLTIGAAGAGIKYFEDSAKNQKAANKDSVTPDTRQNESLLSSMNPFAPAPTVTPTPQLSKEYLYAGSKMLAVEDAGANPAPPADLAVWRPSNGYWYVLGGQGSQQTYFQWGASTDVTAPGDYDGDGKTDFSVYRPSNGTWYIQRSSDNTMQAYAFGASTDLVAPADYDGDGKTDAAVFRPSTGYWYIQRSSDAGMTSLQLGANGDVPAPADYDGDGKADITVWRPTTNTFYTTRTTDGVTQYVGMGAYLPAGQTGSPVSGDYDGDGKADYALLNGNNWIILQSSNGAASTTAWGNAGDTPVQNDYDGDGKVDIACWRDATGTWYIRNSHDGSLRQQQWGQSSDKPVPAFYRR